MLKGLAGKTALVTGGSSGFGEAITLRFAGEGVSVAVCGRDKAKTQAVARRAAETAAAAGHTDAVFHVLLGDVAQVDECERLVAEAVTAFDRLDILVNFGRHLDRETDPRDE